MFIFRLFLFIFRLFLAAWLFIDINREKELYVTDTSGSTSLPYPRTQSPAYWSPPPVTHQHRNQHHHITTTLTHSLCPVSFALRYMYAYLKDSKHQTYLLQLSPPSPSSPVLLVCLPACVCECLRQLLPSHPFTCICKTLSGQYYIPFSSQELFICLTLLRALLFVNKLTWIVYTSASVSLL